MADLKDLLVEAARERWPTPTGLVLVLILAVITLIGIFAGLDLGRISSAQWLIIAASLVAIAATWWFVRLPRVPRGKVGIGVAIQFEDPSHAKTIRFDLIQAMRDLVNDSHFRHEMVFVDFPQHVAERIESAEDAGRLARRSNVHFLLWGRARLRTLPSGSSHVFDIRGLVRHAPIARATRQQLSDDLGNVLPSKLIVGTKGDTFGCEFAARHIDAAARFIVGTAAALSNDFVFAEQLLVDAENRIQLHVQRADGSPPAVLLDRIRVRLAELYEEWLSRLANKYSASPDARLIEEQDVLVEKLRRYQPDNYGGHLVAAFAAFVLRRDMARARQEIAACAGSTDAAWRYSEAFLYAYEGDLQAAYRSYRHAFESPLANANLPAECEEFIQTVIEQEQDRPWLYFCLGLINFRAKGDLISARRDFETFLTRADAARYATQISAVRRWITEIDALLSVSQPSERGGTRLQ